MSHKLDGLVHTQMAVAVSSGSSNCECYGNVRGTPVRRRRRVFVQTETGCVLGMDLDRSDNAHTVKRRLQLALNVPTDERSLTFGDVILKNDLSAIQNDSQLLLTKNVMHRSLSTPCLSPTGRILQQRDQSGPIEILGCSSHCARTKELVKVIMKAIKNGVDPIPVHGGLGGAYYFRNSRGESVAIVKPTDEEPFAPNNPKGFVGKALGQPGLKPSVRVGETGFREVAAYLLDYDQFANVPPTVLVKITHSIFNVNDDVNGNNFESRKNVSKIASLQQFIPHDFDASDHGPSSFPVATVHRIGILDIRIFNTDRHAGNLLVQKLNRVGGFCQMELIPIDHGLCLPESLEDPYFEWIHWPQASIPFSEDELEYIKNLDPVCDSDMLRKELPMIREACLRVLVLCTIFLKEAASFGLCLSEIGEMMSREFSRQEEQPSELEVVCIEAKRMIANSDMSVFEAKGGEDYMFDIDSEDLEGVLFPQMSLDFLNKGLFCSGSKGASDHYPLSMVDENFGEIEVDVTDWPNQDLFQITPKSSKYPKKTDLVGGRSHQLQIGTGTVSGIRRSANEQLPNTTSFVKLADMSKEEWILFLEKFKELLYPAFANHRSSSTGQIQRQRLGTSCQF
ncbi:phosphatidylinositol 4-kinase gamma 7 [Quercus suber]|uniref:phosphatidylinositol 4-kinase gamma 7 n=1 Tax=Quercus suber TaxID=58331 RepID=UPI000CE22A36|nr:phosphatidylinositol 4-kinase gamma 7-like [Quercus suber]POF14817.1 phosphatidylinositol 4-kinase gamma 7 [Quercus suber]